jgi:hypothetical protein
MQRVSSGYTIVEVIIFLAISSVLFIISSLFLSQSEGHNRFSQSMRDTQSKISDILNDIPTGFANGTSSGTGLTCKKVAIGGTSRPQFTSGGGSTTPDCIFLGKVIQFTDTNSPPTTGQDSQIYFYSVFGLRTYTPPGETERPVANLIEASPVAAVNIASYSGNAGSNGDLTEAYTIPGGAKVKKIVKSSGIAGDDSHLGGFFLSFNQLQSTSSGSASLKSYQYPLAGNHYPGNDQTSGNYKDVDDCMSLNNLGSSDCSITSVSPAPTPDKSPPALSDWEICFANDSNSDTALLTINSSNGLGATTKLDFTPC